MTFKYELRFVAFTRPNLCSWGRNFVSGILNLKAKNLFLYKKKPLGFTSPVIINRLSTAITTQRQDTRTWTLGVVGRHLHF